MNKLQILAFVGMPGSGKSSCVDYLAKKGLPTLYFGGITLEETKRRGLEVNEANEKLVREDIRQKEGKTAYAVRIIKKIDDLADQGEKTVVVDGIYSWSEYKLFKERFGDQAIIIAIKAPRHLRHQRLEQRAIRPLTQKEAHERDYAEIENLEKGGPIANADYTIVNDSTIKKLHQKLETLLKQIA